MVNPKDVRIEENPNSTTVFLKDRELPRDEAIACLKELLSLKTSEQGQNILKHNIALLGGEIADAEDSKTGCLYCRYMKADPWETPHRGYYCLCEDSPTFGQIICKLGETDGPGCEYREEAKYKDMSLEKALKIITDDGWRLTNTTFNHRKTKDEHPMIALWFKTNEDLENWRDAYCRIFEEVMKYKRENGEFVDEKQEDAESKLHLEDFPNFERWYVDYRCEVLSRKMFKDLLGVKQETLDRLIKEFADSQDRYSPANQRILLYMHKKAEKEGRLIMQNNDCEEEN